MSLLFLLAGYFVPGSRAREPGVSCGNGGLVSARRW